MAFVPLKTNQCFNALHMCWKWIFVEPAAEFAHLVLICVFSKYLVRKTIQIRVKWNFDHKICSLLHSNSDQLVADLKKKNKNKWMAFVEGTN